MFWILQLFGVVLNWLMFLNLLEYLSTAIGHKKVENMLSLWALIDARYNDGKFRCSFQKEDGKNRACLEEDMTDVIES